jgi:hypothetical protein
MHQAGCKRDTARSAGVEGMVKSCSSLFQTMVLMKTMVCQGSPIRAKTASVVDGKQCST